MRISLALCNKKDFTTINITKMHSPTIVYLDSAASTNSELAQLLQSGKPAEWTVIAARNQTSGRGQAGNIWEAAPGKNICCSICLYPQNVVPTEQFIVSMAIATGVARYLENKGLASQIKWPNDIYVNNKKICGILIENQIMGNSILSTIAGIGLNINQDAFSPSIPNPTSLLLETGINYIPDVELHLLITEVMRSVSAIYDNNSEEIMQEYHRKLYQKDIAHSYYKQGVKFTGIIRRVEKSGGLIMQIVPENAEKTYYFKEISYLPPS